MSDPLCSKLIAQATFDIQRIKKYGNDTQREKLASDLGISKTDMVNMHEGDFAYMIADIPTGFVQNGHRTDLCKIILNETF